MGWAAPGRGAERAEDGASCSTLTSSSQLVVFPLLPQHAEAVGAAAGHSGGGQGGGACERALSQQRCVAAAGPGCRCLKPVSQALTSSLALPGLRGSPVLQADRPSCAWPPEPFPAADALASLRPPSPAAFTFAFAYLYPAQSMAEHVFVYWIAPVAAGIFGGWCFLGYQQWQRQRRQPQRRVKAD